MYIDLSEIINDPSVQESIEIKLVGSGNNKYGLANESTDPEIKTTCCVVEHTVSVLDVSTGSYLPRVVFDFYIPSNLLVGRQLDGATIKTSSGHEYIIQGNPVIRHYTSHSIARATERRVKK